MIIDNKNKTCTLSDEDLKKISEKMYDNDPCPLMIRSMMNDIIEDLERGMQDDEIIDCINSEGLFEMAYEMFETWCYGYIEDTIVSILDDAEIIV